MVFLFENEPKKIAKERAKNVGNELVRNGIDIKKRLNLKTNHLINCEEAKNKVVFCIRN
ncbi:hypothetical protein [Apibacter muscae]|uniref:hypothetical protein n=1 Tax=Apibacter muscae TaxID=2509004 RepID=UPI001626F6C7|nr:hypothetical protein [Apibacter muscae]